MFKVQYVNIQFKRPQSLYANKIYYVTVYLLVGHPLHNYVILATNSYKEFQKELFEAII